MNNIETGDYAYDFTIPVKTPMLNEYLRWHWAKQRQHTKELSWLVLKAVGLDKHRVPLQKCIVVIERYTKSKRRLDWDGLLGGCKGLLDALTKTHPSGVGLIMDDSTDCIVSIPMVLPRECAPGEDEHTRVRIMDVTTKKQGNVPA